MSPKTRNIIGWILTAIVGLVLISTALLKLKGGAEMEKNVTAMGLTMSTVHMIGIVELICALLFIFLRTGVLGTLLVSAYLGGAIATHVQHQLPLAVPVIMEVIVYITAAIRFPELTRRLIGTTVVV